MFEFIKEHLSSSNALSVKLHGVSLLLQDKHILLIGISILIGLPLFFNFLFKVLFEGLLLK
jgi:hypothetical protein